MRNVSLLLAILLGLFVATALSTSCTSDSNCSGDNWCSDCGTCTVGAVGTACCSDDDCSGSNCCDYCSKTCTATTSHCSAYTCSSGATTTHATTAATTTHSTSTTKAGTSTTTTTGSSSGETTYTGVLITSYGWNDNDDGSGSYGNDIIAFPNVLHGHAVEASGAYNDPNTFAADQSFLKPGTLIYVPSVQKYYIMEDECAECDDDWANGKKHVDLWIGPDSATLPADPLYNCEDAITVDSGTIIVNPASTHPVTTTKIFTGGKCSH